MQPRRLLTSSSPGQTLCRITAAYPANALLRPLPPQGRGLFFSNYRDTNGAVNVHGLCGFSTHWPGGHCQGTPSLTLTMNLTGFLKKSPCPQYDHFPLQTREFRFVSTTLSNDAISLFLPLNSQTTLTHVPRTHD